MLLGQTLLGYNISRGVRARRLLSLEGHGMISVVTQPAPKGLVRTQPPVGSAGLWRHPAAFAACAGAAGSPARAEGSGVWRVEGGRHTTHARTYAPACTHAMHATRDVHPTLALTSRPRWRRSTSARGWCIVQGSTTPFNSCCTLRGTTMPSSSRKASACGVDDGVGFLLDGGRVGSAGGGGKQPVRLRPRGASRQGHLRSMQAPALNIARNAGTLRARARCSFEPPVDNMWTCRTVGRREDEPAPARHRGNEAAVLAAHTQQVGALAPPQQHLLHLHPPQL